jgi:hypothetical protein
MGVLAIRRATQQALHRLPSDLTPLIREWIGGTRSDWRTCKQPEARIIEDYNEGIQRFVQEVMARRRARERRERESAREISLYIYPFYRIWIRWYGLYQFIVVVWEWVNSHTRGN